MSRGWKVITFMDELDFSVTGFIARIAGEMAKHGISILVMSSYSHDHLLVREKDMEKAADVLISLGFEVENER